MKNIREFAGAWKDISDENAEKMLSVIKKMKRKTGIKEIKDNFLL